MNRLYKQLCSCNILANVFSLFLFFVCLCVFLRQMCPTHKETSDHLCFDAFFKCNIFISAMKKDMANVIFEEMMDVICKQNEMYITPK